MVVLAVLCGILSIVISVIAVYQSEHLNKLSRELNKDTKLMIDCNEKSINNLHVTLNEIINREEEKESTIENQDINCIRNKIVLIKMRNYNTDNKFMILHNLMNLNNMLLSKEMSDLDLWMDNDENKIELKLSKDLTGEDYKNIKVNLEILQNYGIWICIA